MKDNLRLAQKSLKKISLQNRNNKPYHTIHPLQSQPTRKKMPTATQQHHKKQQHSVLYQTIKQLKHINNLNQPSKKQQRRLSHSIKQKSTISNNEQLNQRQGSTNRRFQSVKFGVLRQDRQKYKRSQHVRSMMQSKKMSSLRKLTIQQQPKSKMDVSFERQDYSDTLQFQDLNLEEIINTMEDSPENLNLQDLFQEACRFYTTHLESKTDLLSQSQISESLKSASNKCEYILKEVGEMSIRNLFILALVHFEYGKYSFVIMYMNKILNKTKGNLFLIEFRDEQKLKLQLNQVSRAYNLNILGYLYLAQSYKATNNFLSAINVLSQCQNYLRSTLSFKKGNNLGQDMENEQQNANQGKGVKQKSSQFTSIIKPEDTISKMKRVFAHNSSIQLNKELIHREHLKMNQGQNIKTKKSLNSVKPTLNYNKPSNHQLETNLQIQITAFYLLFARLHLHIKNYQLAINYYRSSLTINPNQLEAMVEIGCVYKIKEGNKRCLEWLQECLIIVGRRQKKQRLQLDEAYLIYYKGMVLLQDGRSDESYQLFNGIKIRELQSQVEFYKGFIKLQYLKIREGTQTQRNTHIQSILMHFNESISAYTSKTYLIKSYFYKLLILLFQNKDYYGAQYQLNRFHKLAIKAPFKSISLQTPQFNQNTGSYQHNTTDLENEFNLLEELVQGVICILKMKISRGLALVKEVGVRVQGCAWVIKSLGVFYKQIVKLIYQFKFYCYYILREYELSLKHCKKLKNMVEQDKDSMQVHSFSQPTAEIKIININQLMLQCILLIKQYKFNYALSKLQQIHVILNPHPVTVNSSQTPKNLENVSNGFILNNLCMLKALCYINLYCQLEESQIEGREGQEGALQDSNKEILLSAEQLLRQCLITDKQNSLIYYLIGTIHYELNQYESSLKYIREALQFSDDHMIKHYYAKANTKFMLARYDEAIKDYANAVIVFKQQAKVEPKIGREDLKEAAEDEEEYYSEKQKMIVEIYLNRAYAYIKCGYQLTNSADFSDNYNLIANYKIKAAEDILKFIQEINSSEKISGQKQLREALLLLMHTDDPAKIIELQKTLAPKQNLLSQHQIIKLYYQIKELNNCIQLLKQYLDQQQYQVKKFIKHQKDKRLSNNTKKDQILTNKEANIKKLSIDLKCLQALKKSSRVQKGACQEALITLLQMTETIYRVRQQQMQGKDQTSRWQNTLSQSCGQFFKWSDILFFIGVIHFQLEEYETAIKYFQQSYNQKKSSAALYSLAKFTTPVIKLSTSEETTQASFLFQDLEALFQNRIYSKEELQYNIGLCYLMLGKYKQAYYYLQDYPKFITIIKTAITSQQAGLKNEFVEARAADEQRRQKERVKYGKQISKDQDPDVKSYSQSQFSEQREDQFYDSLQNITPFPTHNRLCSIYPPKTIGISQSITASQKFYLSFCLPKIELPLLAIFNQQEIEPAELCEAMCDQSQRSSHISDIVHVERQVIKQKMVINSAIKHVSLSDLQMKPIAPWIRQNRAGVIFTQNLMGYSIELNSERQSLRRDKQQIKDENRMANDRYGQYQIKK